MNILIKNGRIIDPANGVDSIGDIFISGGKVASPATADRVIDASGKLVLPGFIDIHMHEDPVKNGRIVNNDRSIFRCMLRMGVTTAVGGNCGDCACDPVEYLDLADRDGTPVNVAMLAGHEHYRVLSGCTDKYGPATPEQIAQMAQWMDDAMSQGCLGVSYGIRYAPGMTKDEIMSTAKSCSAHGGIMAAHIRDDAAAVFSALDEFVSAGMAVGAPIQVSHIGSMAGFGQMAQFLQTIENYRKTYPDIACDCYPYDAFSTSIGSTTYDEGWLERYNCGYDVLEISEGKYKGLPCTEAIFREERSLHPEYKTVCHVMNSEDIDLALSHPCVMLGSDGTLSDGQGHPRAAGAFPRLLSRYVNRSVVSLTRAVEMMTAQPAKRLGLSSKGHLAIGADADIVIVDPDKLRDNATFTDPIAAPDGIEYVIIGGKICLENGEILCADAGKAVRR